jgi:hypothetical protein
MTKTRQDATIRKIERGVEKLLPKADDGDIAVGGYDDEMGENVRDLESDSEEEGEANQGEGNQGEATQGARETSQSGAN